MSRVLVAIVTWNSAEVLQYCLESIAGQSFSDFRTVIFDNASSDSSVEIAKSFEKIKIQLIESNKNVGFARANNLILRTLSDEEYVLFINPDAIIEANFIVKAIDVMLKEDDVGSISPKIKRYYLKGGNIEKTGIIDSTGIYLTKNGRHFDRGSSEKDNGKFNRMELVFGVTGAIAFYRKRCLEDVAVDGEIWDEDFFAYREDVDLSWRCIWRGWKCVYTPDIEGWHMRRVLPSNRRDTLKFVNMHSVKNRFLLRVKNMPALTWIKFFIPLTFRDVSIICYIILFEWSSLPAFIKLIKLMGHFFRKRNVVLGNARVSRSKMETWFHTKSIPYKTSEQTFDQDI